MIEPYWDEFPVHKGAEEFQRQYEKTPEAVRNLLAAHWCQSELNSGGFYDFFQNNAGVLAPEAAAAFAAIGLPRLAALVKEAMSYLGAQYPRDRQVRMEALKRLSSFSSVNPGAVFARLDDEFRSVAVQWQRHANAYAAKHSAQSG